MLSKDIDRINQLIMENELHPYPDIDVSTYPNEDIKHKVLVGQMDLKMVRCIEWSKDTDIDATPEELYKICPDYYKEYRLCYGLGKNKVVTDKRFIASCDHIHALAKGGSKTIDNLRIVPLDLNIFKRDMDLADWQRLKIFMEETHRDS